VGRRRRFVFGGRGYSKLSNSTWKMRTELGGMPGRPASP
jgi:hypothetical protein